MLSSCFVGGIWRWASLIALMVKNLPAMWETRVQSRSPEDPLEKGMTTRSSILSWRIPWREEPGGIWIFVEVSEYQYPNVFLLSWSVSADRTPPTCSGCSRSMAAQAQQRVGAVGLTAMNTKVLLILPLRTGSQFSPHWAERTRKHLRLLYQVNPNSLIHLS